MSYRKVGGIHFIKVWRFGFNFYISRSERVKIDRAADRAFALVGNAVGVRSRVVNGQRVFN